MEEILKALKKKEQILKDQYVNELLKSNTDWDKVQKLLDQINTVDPLVEVYELKSCCPILNMN